MYSIDYIIYIYIYIKGEVREEGWKYGMKREREKVGWEWR